MVFTKAMLCAFFLALGVFIWAEAKTTPQPPDISGWVAGKTEHINFIIERKNAVYIVYLGDKTEFQNPNGCDEYILVFRRYVPLVIGKTINIKKQGNAAYISAYDKKIKDKAIGQYREKSDIFAYIAYRKVQDGKIGIVSRIDIQKELIGSWLMDQNGKWGYFARFAIREQAISERAAYDSKINIQVGIKFYIPAVQHVLMFDQRLVNPVKEKKE